MEVDEAGTWDGSINRMTRVHEKSMIALEGAVGK